MREKCDTCRLRYVCEEQAEFICKSRNYCDYHPESTTKSSVSNDINKQWIVEKSGNYCIVKCPVCGKDYACHYGMLQLQNFKYCPNCGEYVGGDSK